MAKKKLANFIFLRNSQGITPKTEVYQSNCDHDLSNRITMFIVKSEAAVATDLTNYANFAPFNVLNFALLHVLIMLH